LNCQPENPPTSQLREPGTQGFARSRAEFELRTNRRSGVPASLRGAAQRQRSNPGQSTRHLDCFVDSMAPASAAKGEAGRKLV
jgi:hypothetical protein